MWKDMNHRKYLLTKKSILENKLTGSIGKYKDIYGRL